MRQEDKKYILNVLKKALLAQECDAMIEEVFKEIDLVNLPEKDIIDFVSANPFIYKKLNFALQYNGNIKTAYANALNKELIAVDIAPANWKDYLNYVFKSKDPEMELCIANEKYNSLAYFYKKNPPIIKHVNEKQLAILCKNAGKHPKISFSDAVTLLESSKDYSVLKGVPIAHFLDLHVERISKEDSISSLNIDYDQFNALTAEELTQLFKLIDVGIDVYLIDPKGTNVKLSADRANAAKEIILSNVIHNNNAGLKTPIIEKILKSNADNKDNLHQFLNEVISAVNHELKKTFSLEKAPLHKYYNYLLHLAAVGLGTFEKKEVDAIQKTPINGTQETGVSFWSMLFGSQKKPEVAKAFSTCVLFLHKMKLTMNSDIKRYKEDGQEKEFEKLKEIFFKELKEKFTNLNIVKIIIQEVEQFFIEYRKEKCDPAYKEMIKEIKEIKDNLRENKQICLEDIAQPALEKIIAISECKYNLMQNTSLDTKKIAGSIQKISTFYQVNTMLLKRMLNKHVLPLDYNQITTAIFDTISAEKTLNKITKLAKEAYDTTKKTKEAYTEFDIRKQDPLFAKTLTKESDQLVEIVGKFNEMFSTYRTELKEKCQELGILLGVVLEDAFYNFFEENFIKKEGKRDFTIETFFQAVDEFTQTLLKSRSLNK